MPDDADKQRSSPSLWLRWVVPAIVIAFLFASQAFVDRKPSAPGIAYSSFYSFAEQGKVARITIAGQIQPGTPFSPDQIAEKYWSVVQSDGTWQSEFRFDGT